MIAYKTNDLLEILPPNTITLLGVGDVVVVVKLQHMHFGERETFSPWQAQLEESMRAATSNEGWKHALFCMSVTVVLMLSIESITKIKLKLGLIINI